MCNSGYNGDGMTCTGETECIYIYMYMYVTMPEKIDHSTQILDAEILVPLCSALFTLYNGEVRTVIAYTILE